MNALSWIDNRTLLASQSIVVAAFSLMMLGLHAVYPKLRGARSVALGCVLALPALLMIAGSAPMTPALVWGAGGCVLLCSILLYRGVLEFCAGGETTISPASLSARAVQAKPGSDWMVLVYAACLASLLVMAWCTRGTVRVAPCITAITLTLALSRGLMARALVRCKSGPVEMRLFGYSMGIFALLTAGFAVVGMVRPVSTLTLVQGSAETPRLLVLLLFLCVQGVFYLLMFAGGVTRSVYEEARRDYLSGTLNRRGIEDALQSEIARTRRTGGNLAVLLIDLDKFKGINDALGHAAGDEALRRVAREICRSVRVYDSVGRYGGDEFLVLLPETGSEDAMQTAGRIRAALRSEDGPALSTTLSIGATCCTSQEEVADVVARADEALYRAKREGRDCERLQLRGSTQPSVSDEAPVAPLKPVGRAT